MSSMELYKEIPIKQATMVNRANDTSGKQMFNSRSPLALWQLSSSNIDAYLTLKPIGFNPACSAFNRRAHSKNNDSFRKSARAFLPQRSWYHRSGESHVPCGYSHGSMESQILVRRGLLTSIFCPILIWNFQLTWEAPSESRLLYVFASLCLASVVWVFVAYPHIDTLKYPPASVSEMLVLFVS